MIRPLTRRTVTAVLFGAMMFSAGASSAGADYNFVRIEGLAEQAVGARLLEEVYRRAGYEITITPMPGKRAIQEAATGKKDGETLRIFALGENEKRLIRVPTPLSDLQTAAFVKADSNIKISKKEDLKSHTSAVVTGVLHTQAITEGIKSVNAVRDPSTMFKLVQAGRAEIALTSGLDGRANLAREGITDLVAIEPPLKTLELYHYIHESKAEIVPQIDAVIKEMKASGELAELRAKFEQEYIDSMSQ